MVRLAFGILGGLSAVLSMCPSNIDNDAAHNLWHNVKAWNGHYIKDHMLLPFSNSGTMEKHTIKLVAGHQVKLFPKVKNSFNRMTVYNTGKVRFWCQNKKGGCEQAWVRVNSQDANMFGSVYYKREQAGGMQKYGSRYYKPNNGLVITWVGMNDGSDGLNCETETDSFQMVVTTQTKRGGKNKRQHESVVVNHYGMLVTAYDNFNIGMARGDNGFVEMAESSGDIKMTSWYTSNPGRPNYQQFHKNSCARLGQCKCSMMFMDEDVKFPEYNTLNEIKRDFNIRGRACKGVTAYWGSQTACILRPLKQCTITPKRYVYIKMEGMTYDDGEPKTVPASKFICQKDDETNRARWRRVKQDRELRLEEMAENAGEDVERQSGKKAFGIIRVYCGFKCRHPALISDPEDLFYKGMTVDLNSDRDLIYDCSNDRLGPSWSYDGSGYVPAGTKCKPVCTKETNKTPKNSMVRGNFLCSNVFAPEHSVKRHTGPGLGDHIEFLYKDRHNSDILMQAGRSSPNGYRCVDYS